MNNDIDTDDLFSDSWDLSMSTILDAFEHNKLTGSYRSSSAERQVLSANSTFFGLPNSVKNMILKYKGIESLYDWQIDCLNLPAINERKNLVYSLPTSGGKTLVAEILMLKELLIHKRNVIFVLPYVALAQEKVRSLAPFGLDLKFYVEEYVGGKGKYPPLKHMKKRSIYVCTTEKAAGLIESLLDCKRLQEIGMLVVDEIHLIGEPSRGPTLEMMLTKLMFVTKDIHIIAMSATVGNLNEIGHFLNARVYTHNFRPVELVEYVKCSNNVYKIVRDADGDCSLVQERVLNFNYPEDLQRMDPGLLGGLVREVIPDDSCLVFCPTKKQCSHFAMLICQAVDRTFKEIRKDEKKSLLRALAEEGHGIVCPILTRTIPHGVAYHHSGLTNAERKLLEEAFIAGAISCICCTSTLAAGINLPAKRVIIFSPYVGKDFLKLSTYKQMSGRAGRMGFTDVGESYLVCQENDMPKILDLLKSTMDRCDSKMTADNFIRFTTCAIGLHIANIKSDLKQLCDITLQQIQNRGKENNASAEEIVEQSLQTLTSLKAVKVTPETGEYALTHLASAAMTANLDVTEAQCVYNNLIESIENGLILSNYLHLFYLVTPFSAIDEIKLDRQVVIAVYSELSSVERKIAERIGITELCLIQYSKNGKVSALNMEELEYFPALLQKIIPRISYCCTSELLQLMQLPAVKIGRANQLYKAGYKNLQDVMNADPVALVSSVDHLPRRVAYEIVAAAKLIMLQKAETLQEEADNIKAELTDNKNVADISLNGIEELPASYLSTPQVKKPKV